MKRVFSHVIKIALVLAMIICWVLSIGYTNRLVSVKNTFNIYFDEEEYLPVLLDSIKEQSFKDYEIIVADANSTDRTREIAEEYGCTVVDGGMPAVGRNRGPEVAKGEIH